MPIPTILVVQGAEYQAVCRGIRKVGATPQVIPLPIGQAPVQIFLESQLQQGLIADRSQMLVMGLCGSLRSDYSIGDQVVYQQVLSLSRTGLSTELNIDRCDPQLTALLQQRLNLKLVKAWSSDRFIHSVQTKQHLGQAYDADVVDMEGAAVFTALAEIGAAVTMLRVVSDGCDDELPNLSGAISPSGRLMPQALLRAMLRQPIGSLRLMRGIWIGLKVLENVTARLFAELFSQKYLQK